MIIDCDSCPVRGHRCDDCVIGLALTGPTVPLDALEAHAVDLFARAGLVTVREAAGAVARREPWATRNAAAG